MMPTYDLAAHMTAFPRRMLPRSPVVALLAGLLMAGCAPQAVQGGIPPVAVTGARPAPSPLPAQLRLPPGPGPFAVVIVLHGCAGIGMNTTAWADRLIGWNYGALILDSLTPRAQSSVCAQDRQSLVTRFDRAGDVIAAARWLQHQPGVDGKRLAVLGESHGGGTAATVTLHPFIDAADGLIKGAVNYYGNCRNADRYGGLPLLALAGEDDTWGPPAATCRRFMDDLPPSSPVTLHTYPGVVHAFDNPNLVQRRYGESHPMQYDQRASEDSFARTHAFLDRLTGSDQ